MTHNLAMKGRNPVALLNILLLFTKQVLDVLKYLFLIRKCFDADTRNFNRTYV